MTATRKILALCITALLIATVAVVAWVSTRATTAPSLSTVGATHPDAEAVLSDESVDPATAQAQAQLIQAQHNADQLRREYADAAKQLPALPAGAVVDVEERVAQQLKADTTHKNGAVAVYEEGYFSSLYAMDWQCAWVEEAMAAGARGDEPGREEAIATFQGFAASALAAAFPDFENTVSKQVATAVRAGGGPAVTDFRNTTCAP